MKQERPTVYVECQHGEKSYAVYVGGDDDTEGAYDRVYSWGDFEEGRVTRQAARKAAMDYARGIAKQIGALPCFVGKIVRGR